MVSSRQASRINLVAFIDTRYGINSPSEIDDAHVAFSERPVCTKSRPESTRGASEALSSPEFLFFTSHATARSEEEPENLYSIYIFLREVLSAHHLRLWMMFRSYSIVQTGWYHDELRMQFTQVARIRHDDMSNKDY